MAEKKKLFVRKTKQREVILDVLRNTDCHPTADWIYQEVRKELPNISLGTVYRNLRCLTEMGEALELCYGSTYSRFDGNPEPHYHFVCEKCGQVYDMGMTVMRDLEKLAAADTGFTVTDHRLEFYGICSACKAADEENNESAS